MKCQKCQTENREEAKFCRKCGAELEFKCPSCGTLCEKDSLFCDQCGQRISEIEEEITTAHFNGERKHVTVLFSDLSGYTTMTEKLDPEEVKEITTRIFGDIAKIIDRYEGFIEKYAGDAVMALFGVPIAHEDDSLRAIRVAREIHRLVNAISPEIEKRIGQSISMHTGINAGLVVTGELNLEKGIHGVAGDTVNVASRLSSIAEADEILVGNEVFRQTFGHFHFEAKEHIKLKGKSETVLAHKVISPKEEPASGHSLSVLKAQLIGRKSELDELRKAVADLKNGKGRIFCISGDAGTGKSRLMEEFRAQVHADEIHWLECHSYPYTQNIPYFPLIDLLNRVLGIEEEDPQETVRQKIESGITSLVGQGDGIIPYVGSLYAIESPEISTVSPEFWKAQIQKTMKTVLSALALRTPTIFLLEDLQWADPSFVELLRHTLLEVREPAIVLCIYRPSFNLFTSHQLKGLEKFYREIRLQDLSSSDAQDMLTSLLMTDRIPSEVRRVVQEKAEGNPFYLEEMTNSLIDAEVLVRNENDWKLTGPIQKSNISSTIQGIIASRLDRLEKEAKLVLQEASVIGRSFLYEILQRISKLEQDIDKCLRNLEQLDFIRTKCLHPDLEYVFKHALTQEVVYGGLLKKDRREIHERIGLVMERLFSDRLPECYEALAFHFSQGSSVMKAVDYLVKSGKKSHKRYALEESHRYFTKAYEMLSSKDARTREEDLRIVDLLLAWGYVHNCRADYKGMEEHLLANEALAKSLNDKERLGMFYAWIGWSLRSREKLRNSHEYLIKALELGNEMNNQRVIGYACAWLSWTCADMGLLDDAVTYGKRARDLIEPLKSDTEFVRFTLSGLGMTYYFRGDCDEAYEMGDQLLKHGQRRSDLRCITMGHTCMGFSYYVSGNHSLAIESFKNGIQVSADNLFTNAARLLLGMTYVADGQIKEGEETLEEVMPTSDDYGFEFLGTAAQLFYGAVLISKGSLNEGVGIVENAVKVFQKTESRSRYATANYIMGKVYSGLVLKEKEKSFSLIAKNIGFLMKNIPVAGKKAAAYFGKAIEVSEEIGAKGNLGQAYLDLGRLHRAKKRDVQASECFMKAIDAFKQCKANEYLRQAEEALSSLG